ncbi:Yip1 family protein [Streptomyces sp. NPDC001262]|uniref:Yip1 family protein n=1 Tax=Streptomyces TaxID=1883 RepID=UPI0036802588
MSQLGRKAGPVPLCPGPGALRSGYVRSVAGFRMGRGRDDRHPNPAPQGQQQWQQPGGYDEPEYFGGATAPQPGYGQQQPPVQHGYAQGGQGAQGGPYQDPYYGGPPPGDPGRTQQFAFGEAPDAYGSQGPGQGGPDPYAGYGTGSTYGPGQPAAPAPPPGPRLHWKELLSGIVLRPSATFWQMRDHAMWGPALIVTFVYGLLAVFGFDKARQDVLHATLADSIPWVLATSVIVLMAGLILGAVTHTLARQLGGDGMWQPTVGLSMLIMSLTDAPRLLFAMFLGGDSPLVQVLGWATWLAGGVLLTSMVSKSHDLPWPKALGASAIQLVALLSLMKLGTL